VSANHESLPDPYPLPTLGAGERIESSASVPASKSLSNRALLLAAMVDGESNVRNPLIDADDGDAMLGALRMLSVHIDIDRATARVRGPIRAPSTDTPINIRGAGTAMRFLAAACALAEGPVTLDGDARMRQRPIGELADALSQLGARVEYLGQPGFPPVRVHPIPLDKRAASEPKLVRLPVTASSQFVSALLLIGPWVGEGNATGGGIRVVIDGDPPSKPYIDMTLRLLERLGARVTRNDALNDLTVRPAPDSTGLAPFDITIEPDASAATYFLAAGAAIPGSVVRIDHLAEDSLQGDAKFHEVLRAMGAHTEWKSDTRTMGVCRKRSFTRSELRLEAPDRLRAIDADLAGMPDAAMTLAALAILAEGTTTIRGLRTLRVKESDRLAALKAELKKVGATVDIFAHTRGDGTPDEGLRITPPEGGIDRSQSAPRVEFETYKDHRMAMALAIVGLVRPNCFVRDPGCVRKTFPHFWECWSGMAAAASKAP
jgi:3-phosphoshikimate 1-carboxyvinyltransferase